MKLFIVIALTLSTLAAADETYTWQTAFDKIIATPDIFHDDGDLVRDVNKDCVHSRLGIDGKKGNKQAPFTRVLFAFFTEAIDCFENRNFYTDKQFSKWLNKYKNDEYKKAVGCFKKALLLINPKAEVLIGFDPASVQQTQEECDLAIKDVLDEYKDRMAKSEKTYGSFLACNRHLKNKPDHFQGIFYEFVILANDNVTTETLAHKKEWFRDDFLDTMKHAKQCFREKTNEP